MIFLQASPGAAIAQQLSAGKNEILLVLAAVAIIIGVLTLWSYIKSSTGGSTSSSSSTTSDDEVIGVQTSSGYSKENVSVLKQLSDEEIYF